MEVLWLRNYEEIIWYMKVCHLQYLLDFFFFCTPSPNKCGCSWEKEKMYICIYGPQQASDMSSYSCLLWPLVVGRCGSTLLFTTILKPTIFIWPWIKEENKLYKNPTTTGKENIRKLIEVNSRDSRKIQKVFLMCSALLGFPYLSPRSFVHKVNGLCLL